jgi:hypothetical protein
MFYSNNYLINYKREVTIGTYFPDMVLSENDHDEAISLSPVNLHCPWQSSATASSAPYSRRQGFLSCGWSGRIEKKPTGKL